MVSVADTETIRPELEYLATAAEYCFRGRVDKSGYSGPVIARGRGSVVFDVEGREYIDFNSGMMCAALGHNHPRIVEAVRESCELIIHASSSLYNTKEIELARRLARVMEPPLKKSFFLTTGSDANEAALAAARKYTGAAEVASPHVGFHGLNDSTRAVTYGVPDWHKGYGTGQTAHAIFAPYCYRCPLGLTYPKCEIACLDASFELLDAQTSGPLAAVITEPMFSAGGVIPTPPGWLFKLREAVHARGALLVLDEEQTGLAKTGSMWMHQQEGVTPDILTTAKHFGGGMAISALVTTPEIEEGVVSRGFVFGHSNSSDPIACNAALATLGVIEEESLPDRALDVGGYWRAHLERLASHYEIVGDVRGRGVIQGIELVKDRTTRTAYYEAGPRIARQCLTAGLIFSVRRGGSVLRFVPPFSTTHAQMDHAAEVLELALRDAQTALVNE
jgi:2,2-dialkylglycine decarboxylase (pyruvate)